VKKTSITLSIDAPVKYAALRAFAGKARGQQLSAFVQNALVKHCVKIGEFIPPQFLPTPKRCK
jgi:hypothetical protein